MTTKTIIDITISVLLVASNLVAWLMYFKTKNQLKKEN
jgi:hypothetical protein